MQPGANVRQRESSQPERTEESQIGLAISNLSVEFTQSGRAVRVVDGLSLHVPQGKTVALLGESGCGKSVTALSVLRLLPMSAKITGQILFRDSGTDHVSDLVSLNADQMRRFRGSRIAMIFQDPMTAFHPVQTIGYQLTEVIRRHHDVTQREAWSLAVSSLKEVGIPSPELRMRDFPHQFSGGMRQRVMIAMALSCKPSLLIADEPTTALDATVQLQILNLLKNLRDRHGMSLLLITHDVGVVAQMADHVYVMYAGRIVEHAPVDLLLRNPLHPYTSALLACLPAPGIARGALTTIPGNVPVASQFPSGCRFHPRCARSRELALQSPDDSTVIDDGSRVLRRCAGQTSGPTRPSLRVERTEQSRDREGAVFSRPKDWLRPSATNAYRGPELMELAPGHFAACPEVIAAGTSTRPA